jgi:lipopolysaccharide/colanic/teichoic acid biosynthesis glycosyltransferase
MNRSSIIRVLVVEKDEIIFNRINNLLKKSCSVIRQYNAVDAIAWIKSEEQVDMVIVNEANGGVAILNELHAADYQAFVPSLLLCNLLSDKLVKLAVKSKATDILPTNENKFSFDRKIIFFSELAARIARQPETTYNPANSFYFKLPIWKRCIDIAVSSTALLALSPLLVIVSILIKLDSKGPIFYLSKRVGSNFKIFHMIKFRTMTTQADKMIKQMESYNIYNNGTEVEAEQEGESAPLCDTCQLMGTACQRLLFDQNQFICENRYLQSSEGTAKFLKFRNDPRVTRLGSFLRNSSIDELPQLINILLGDMSLVGNRPLPVYEAEKLTVNDSVKRFAGPSGLTGLWQVEKRARGQKIMQDFERISLDIEYVETFSFKKDMNIIGKTFFRLWQKENV